MGDSALKVGGASCRGRDAPPIESPHQGVSTGNSERKAMTPWRIQEKHAEQWTAEVQQMLPLLCEKALVRVYPGKFMSFEVGGSYVEVDKNGPAVRPFQVWHRRYDEEDLTDEVPVGQAFRMNALLNVIEYAYTEALGRRVQWSEWFEDENWKGGEEE